MRKTLLRIPVTAALLLTVLLLFIDPQLFLLPAPPPPPVSAAQICLVPPPGLVSWWPADSNANDIVGINNGSLLGGVRRPLCRQLW